MDNRIEAQEANARTRTASALHRGEQIEQEVRALTATRAVNGGTVPELLTLTNKRLLMCPTLGSGAPLGYKLGRIHDLRIHKKWMYFDVSFTCNVSEGDVPIPVHHRFDISKKVGGPFLAALDARWRAEHPEVTSDR